MAALVIFDCDGVLLDTEAIGCAVFAETLQASGFDIDARALRAFIGVSTRNTYATLEARFARPIPETTRGQVRAAFHSALRGLKPMPGLPAVLDALTVPVCVASNSSRESLHSMLATAGLAGRSAGRIFSAAEVAHPKPAPDLFLHAEQHMRVPPRDCVVIEDSVHGIAAAVAAGIPVVGFAGGSHCDAGHAEVLRRAGAVSVCQDMAAVGRALARGDLIPS